MLLSLLGCTSRERQFVGDVGGRRLEVQALQRREPMSTKLWTSLRWGDLPPLAIDSDATSAGAPYSLSLYGDAPVVVIDELGARYSAERTSFGSGMPVPVMLYLDPSRFTRAQFDQYAAFFRDEWPRVSQGIRLSQGFRDVVIVGLVHGRDADFVRRFGRADGGGPGRIAVWTNGDIHLEVDMGVRSSNLAQRLQMPGYRILLTPGGEFSLAELGSYRDAAGRALTEVFEVVERP